MMVNEGLQVITDSIFSFESIDSFNLSSFNEHLIKLFYAFLIVIKELLL